MTQMKINGSPVAFRTISILDFIGVSLHAPIKQYYSRSTLKRNHTPPTVPLKVRNDIIRET